MKTGPDGSVRFRPTPDDAFAYRSMSVPSRRLCKNASSKATLSEEKLCHDSMIVAGSFQGEGRSPHVQEPGVCRLHTSADGTLTPPVQPGQWWEAQTSRVARACLPGAPRACRTPPPCHAADSPGAAELCLPGRGPSGDLESRGLVPYCRAENVLDLEVRWPRPLRPTSPSAFSFFSLQSAPRVHRRPFCLERTGEWAGAGFPGTVTGPGAVKGSRGVTPACHRVRVAAIHNTSERAGLQSVLFTRTGHGLLGWVAGLGRGALRFADPPDVGPSTCGEAGAPGATPVWATTPASCWGVSCL